MPHQREHPQLARPEAGDRVNIQPLLDALDVQEDVARALADDLRAQIDDLQNRPREADTYLEHLALTRKTVTTLADRLPAHPVSLGVPEHPDYPRVLAGSTELLPKNIEGTRAEQKRLVKLDVLIEVDVGSLTRKQ
ncbi:hypothetical protein [Streptomyces sp. NPDC086777]|uniref:hypothetical protein n=1 Tax=Streptomyces sp. NPDC086777 TaxID=3154866 RepID=UPI00344C379A